MNNCFLLNPEKKFGTNLSCRFREKRKNRSTPIHFNLIKMVFESLKLTLNLIIV